MQSPPEFKQILGHPAPLWMLFMTEFWERFAYYGLRWALVLYIVTAFYDGAASGQASAVLVYGSYTALVYAAAVFGGWAADRLIGQQRSVLIGGAIMAAGLCLLMVPNQTVFYLGLATIVVGNGLFKPNISTLVGQLYAAHDTRRDSAFTIFYMGINAGSFVSPLLTGFLAQYFADGVPAYKLVFFVSAAGMVISFLWFFILRHQLAGIGDQPLHYIAPRGGSAAHANTHAAHGHIVVPASRIIATTIVALACIPLVYILLQLGALYLQAILSALFVGVFVLLITRSLGSSDQRGKTIALIVIFIFNVVFWVFFEQAGNSFTFLADNIVDRTLGGWEFPTAWFQSINPISIVLLAPVVAWLWVRLGRYNPNTAVKFALGIIINASAFLLLVLALATMVDDAGKIPFWTLSAVYVIQSIGELCLSPIGLSMVTRLAPAGLVSFAMGGWFLCSAMGNNLSGIFASFVSGDEGLSVASAGHAYMMGFWILLSFGVLLLILSPWLKKKMGAVGQ